MHENFDDLFSGQHKKTKLSDADILESKEVALDRIHSAEALFLTTKQHGTTKMDVVWLAPVKLKDAFHILEGVDALRAAIWQQYVDMLENEGEL